MAKDFRYIDLVACIEALDEDNRTLRDQVAALQAELAELHDIFDEATIVKPKPRARKMKRDDD